MVDIQKPVRSFKMGATDLPDPDSSLSPEQVKELYSDNFPHLANASITDPVPDAEGRLVYEFKAEEVKTKG